MAIPIPRPLPAEGFAVAIDGARRSFRWLGFIPGYARNDLGAQLTLYPTQLAVKVVGTNHHAYAAIRQVDFLPEGSWRREQVVLKLADQSTTYYLYTKSVAVARDLLRFCRERGLPLTPTAQHAAAT